MQHTAQVTYTAITLKHRDTRLIRQSNEPCNIFDSHNSISNGKARTQQRNSRELFIEAHVFVWCRETMKSSSNCDIFKDGNFLAVWCENGRVVIKVGDFDLNVSSINVGRIHILNVDGDIEGWIEHWIKVNRLHKHCNKPQN